MSSLTSKYWRLKEPHSPNFFSGYVAGQNWANDEATKQELSNIAAAMLLVNESDPVSEWPFTHSLLENLKLPELTGYSAIERFYFIIRPNETGNRSQAAEFMQSKMELMVDEMFKNLFKGTRQAKDKRPETLMFGNTPHFVNGFIFGAFHYWLDIDKGDEDAFGHPSRLPR
jgi:hypothetical protein